MLVLLAETSVTSDEVLESGVVVVSLTISAVLEVVEPVTGVEFEVVSGGGFGAFVE